MSAVRAPQPPCSSGVFRNVECGTSAPSPSPAAENLGFAKLRGINVAGLNRARNSLVLRGGRARSKPNKAKDDAGAPLIDDYSRKCSVVSGESAKPIKAKEESDSSWTEDCAAFPGTNFDFGFFSSQLACLKSYRNLECGYIYIF